MEQNDKGKDMAIKDKEIYKGRTIKQVKGIIKIFDSFFEKEKFQNIIEIGTGNGVFSPLVSDIGRKWINQTKFHKPKTGTFLTWERN